MKILLLEAGRCGIITNSNVQSVRFGRLAQRERRCLTSTRPGVQIPHRPPLTQRPPAMGVFFVSGAALLDLNPARRPCYARKTIRGTRHSPHGLAWMMPLLCCKLMRLSGARPFGSTSFPVPASLVPTLSGLLFGSSRRSSCRKNDAKTPKSTVGGRSIPRKSGAARFRFVSGAHDLGFCKPGIHYM